MKYIVKMVIGITIGLFGGSILDFALSDATQLTTITCGITWGIISFCLGMLIGEQLFKPGVLE